MFSTYYHKIFILKNETYHLNRKHQNMFYISFHACNSNFNEELLRNWPDIFNQTRSSKFTGQNYKTHSQFWKRNLDLKLYVHEFSLFRNREHFINKIATWNNKLLCCHDRVQSSTLYLVSIILKFTSEVCSEILCYSFFHYIMSYAQNDILNLQKSSKFHNKNRILIFI